MRTRVIVCAVCAILLVCALDSSAEPGSVPVSGGAAEKGKPGPDRVLVLDGSGTHDVGQLLIHTANWGIFGSFPNSGMPFSQFPCGLDM